MEVHWHRFESNEYNESTASTPSLSYIHIPIVFYFLLWRSINLNTEKKNKVPSHKTQTKGGSSFSCMFTKFLHSIYSLHIHFFLISLIHVDFPSLAFLYPFGICAMCMLMLCIYDVSHLQ